MSRLQNRQKSLERRKRFSAAWSTNWLKMEGMITKIHETKSEALSSKLNFCHAELKAHREPADFLFRTNGQTFEYQLPAAPGQKITNSNLQQKKLDLKRLFRLRNRVI